MVAFGQGPFGATAFGGGEATTPPPDPTTGPATLVSLVGDPLAPPRKVQITARGLTPGQPYTIVGRDTRGNEWEVRGSGRVAGSTTEVLGDIRAPLNTPVTYERTSAAGVDVSDPVVVPYPGRQVLQSLDGFTTVPVWWIDDGDEREQTPRHALYDVGGRSRMPARVDIALDDAGSMRVHTIEPYTQVLKDLIEAGDPILVRTDGEVDDVPATDIVLITRAPRRKSGGYRRDASGALVVAREWRLSWVSQDDPEPQTVIAVATFADFDAVWAGRTFADFDAAWAGQTFADFDRFDWSGEAS